MGSGGGGEKIKHKRELVKKKERKILKKNQRNKTFREKEKEFSHLRKQKYKSCPKKKASKKRNLNC